MRTANFLALLSVFLALPIVGCGSIARDYVDADELTLNAISPEYRRYVENDPTMSEDDKNLRYANLDSWAYRVEQAKKAGE